eukprot:gene13997-biopygen18601
MPAPRPRHPKPKIAYSPRHARASVLFPLGKGATSLWVPIGGRVQLEPRPCAGEGKEEEEMQKCGGEGSKTGGGLALQRLSREPLSALLSVRLAENEQLLLTIFVTERFGWVQ